MYRTGLALFCALVFGVTQANASINGVAVESATSSDTVGAVDPDGNTVYFIPLSSAATGTFGVTDIGSGVLAGTTSDSGSGTGYADATALNMFVRYDLSSAFVPSAASEITIEFEDLDLDDLNDPSGFFESFRVSYFDDAGVEQALTDTITDLSDGFGFLATGVGASFVSGGNNDPLTLTFSGSGLTDIINDVADAGGTYSDEFFLNFHFGSRSSGNNSNTAEKVISSALTSAVPEPGSIAIWSILVAGVGFARRRRA